MISLDGKVVLVTGGASGLGKATVERLVKNGCKVAILDLPKSQGEKVAADIGNQKCLFCPCDVTSSRDVENAMEAIISEWERLDVAVNCAGILFPRKTINSLTKTAHSLKDFSRIIDVNLCGTFNVGRLAAKEMAKNPAGQSGERGVIINTSSSAAFGGQIGTVAYSASKGGVVSMTLPMARDLAPVGIRVMSIAPGIIKTPLFSFSEKSKIRTLEDILFPKRPGFPDEFAHCVQTIIENQLYNASTIHLDAGLRLQAGDRKTIAEMKISKL